MIRESEVKDQLVAVRRNMMSLAEFERWLGPASWNMHSDSLPSDVEFVSLIHVLLSERDDRILDEAGLRRELLSLIDGYVPYSH